MISAGTMVPRWLSVAVQPARRPRAGSQVRGQLEIANPGDASLGQYDVRFFLSQDSKLDASDTPAGHVMRSGISAGRRGNVQFLYACPRGFNPSGWYLIAQVVALRPPADVNVYDNVAVFGPLP